MKEQELEWRPAIRIELASQNNHPVTSVAFIDGWVFAKSQTGIVVFPAQQVVKVSLG